MRLFHVLLPALLLVASCASSISADTKMLLDSSINCETAELDIAALEDARPSGGKRTVAAVRSVLPVAAVTGVLTGDTVDRARVASGRHSDDIDGKIERIRSTCGIETPTVDEDVSE